jgi:hypothetical protein
MTRWITVSTLLAALALSSCDGPDEIYTPLPDNYDAAKANGLEKASVIYSGKKGFFDETRGVVTVGPSVEVCTDTELADKWAEMMTKAITPMVGAAGLDMRGEDWAGLTVDEAQSKEMLCQPSYMGDGIVAWGDNFEVIAIFDTLTRKISDMLLWPGYEGGIEAPPYVFKVNNPIKKNGVPLDRTDGSDRDPRTEENMRDINRALLRVFRDDVPGGPDAADCIETGSCFVITSGTLPLVVFIDVGLYVPFEPTNLRLTQIEVSLKRPFDFKTSTVEFDGPVPTIHGFGSCNITFGTAWSHVQEACIGEDPLTMAEFKPDSLSEWIAGDFDGAALDVRRDLADDQIIRLGEMPQPTDTIVGIAVGEQYEGPITLPFSPVLGIFKQKLMDEVRAQAGLDPADPTGVETLRVPGDPNLPADVAARYPDRLQPRTVKAAFCTDDGPDSDTTYDSCTEDVNGSKVLLLVKTVQANIATTLATRMPPILRERTFYAKLFLESLFEYFNGAPLVQYQALYYPSGRADDIRGQLMMKRGGQDYTIWTGYDGQDDRLGWLQIYNGYNRTEEVLARDAQISGGVFLFDTLIASTRLGLGSDNIAIGQVVPDIRRAILDFTISESEVLTRLVPYVPGSSTEGYWIPQEGAHNEFHTADAISLGGYTFGASFYLVPKAGGEPDQREVAGVISDSFYGPVSFCGQSVELGDWVEDILGGIAASGYPCDLIITWSEGETFILSLASMGNEKKKLYFDNDRFYAVFAWL